MYYIIEHDVRPDGITNTSEVGRSSLAQALSYFYDRQSKLVVNTDFVSAHLMLVTETMQIVKKEDVPTAYVAPETAPEPAPEPAPEQNTEE